jgi:polar amino acid transport system permease protein
VLDSNSIYFIASGAFITLKYSILSVLFGMILGIVVALMRVTQNCFLRGIAELYVSIIRGTPLLVQLSVFYLAMPSIIGADISVFAAGIAAFSINSGAYLSVHIYAGIKGVDRGQVEAAKALGIPYYRMMRDIILPQAFVKILPSLVNEMINMVKESSIIAIFGEMDLMRRAQVIAAEQYQYMIPLLVAGLCYYIIVTLLSFLAGKIEEKVYAEN